MKSYLFLVPLLSVLISASASTLKDDEELIIFPTYGHLTPDHKFWLISIHGIVYEPEKGSRLRDGLVTFFGKHVHLNKDELHNPLFRERARLFLIDNERGKRISVALLERTYNLKRTRPNGHIEDTLLVPSKILLSSQSQSENWIPIESIPLGQDNRIFYGKLQLIGEEGISVISDIDDTIKITEVTDREAMIHNTFLKEFQPVPGISKVYRSWQKDGAVFHYLSASPWQLFSPLSKFIEKEDFPPGIFHLKHFRWKDSSLFALFESPEKYKREGIEPIFRDFPKRRFILVGDSSEKDPEIYGEIAREHPGQIEHIFIRDVDGKGDGIRYKKAFESLPSTLWKVFRDPSEMILSK